jgi:hypothetical protein
MELSRSYRPHKYATIDYKGKRCCVWHSPGPVQVDVPELLPFGAHWADYRGIRNTTTLYCDSLTVLRRVCALAERGKMDDASALLARNQTKVSRVLVKLSHIDWGPVKKA